MSNAIKILLVEDEELIRMEMQEILELEYENIEVACNGQEGLEKYKSFKPDIVVSDIQMPIMDGLEMIEKIQEYGDEVEYILITAFTEDKYLIQASKLSIQYYISKPIDINKLFDTLYKCKQNILRRENV